jgi:hypothetical protein
MDMSQEALRKEVLELLAKGKIGIDEAASLLDQSVVTEAAVDKETAAQFDQPLKVEVDSLEKAAPQAQLAVEEIPMPAKETADKQPSWLRISVGDLETGKSKVRVNLPIGMVKFGLNMAQIFAPGDYSKDLGQMADLLAGTESGLLVDVEDAESNEHVRIYLE